VDRVLGPFLLHSYFRRVPPWRYPGVVLLPPRHHQRRHRPGPPPRRLHHSARRSRWWNVRLRLHLGRPALRLDGRGLAAGLRDVDRAAGLVHGAAGGVLPGHHPAAVSVQGARGDADGDGVSRSGLGGGTGGAGE